jgi:polygalacturonase
VKARSASAGIAFAWLLAAGVGAAPTCRVTDHGAKGDGTTLDTGALQAAIDSCASQKGGTVVVPGPATYLTGTILLKDHVTLHLERGAVLLGSSDFKDYVSIDPFVDGVNATRGACLVGAENARDIAITGEGTIDGRGELWTRDHPERERRPFLVRFARCRNVRISGVLMTRPAAWTCNLYQCRDVHIDRLRIDSHANANNDGIDLDGCRDVRITGCTIDSGDDAICFKTTSLEPTRDVTVTDCDIKSRWGAFKWGTESLGDMRGFRISRCRIRDTAGGGFKILSADGAHIEDIRIEDVTLDGVDMPISFILRSRRRSYRGLPSPGIGSIRNVRIENVTGRAPDTGRVNPSAGILISGLPGHPVIDVFLRNIRLSLPGGATETPKVVPLQEADYPEYGRLGVLPAFGAFVRHARDVRFEDVQIEARQPDVRPEIVSDDADVVGKKGRLVGETPASGTPLPPSSR